MKIYFEKWIEDNQIFEEAMNLFMESISCYRIGAYRSAFIMSYIAFQNILKQRILNASLMPTNISENMWNEICSKLRDEDEWDNKVAECVKRTAPNKIFLIPASAVTLYDGFRCVRNICAHGKSGKIEYFHVENLWNYIQENYLKFVVNGGKSGIIKMIEDHYDTSITPLGTDCTYILDNIKIGLKDDEIECMLDELYQLSVKESPYGNHFSPKVRQIDLWDKLVNSSTQLIQEHIITFFKNKHTDVIDHFIERYPHTAELFMSDEHFLRKLWKEIIFNEWATWCEGTWIVLNKIIDNNVVPEKEKDEFNQNLYKFIGKLFPNEKVELLKKTDYFHRLKNDLFYRNQYSYPNTFYRANDNAKNIVQYLNVCGMDLESVEIINYIVGQMQYGEFIDCIKKYLQTSDNWSSFRTILKENDICDNTIKFNEE